MAGMLSMVGTPIGNLSDASPRVLDTLRAADVLLCEDTRVTSKLLARFQIRVPLVRADENVLAERVAEVVARVEAGGRLVNMDSMAPNKAAMEWLSAGHLGPLDSLRAEVTVGESRFDFAAMQDGRPVYIEVKGCTLEVDGVAHFPDAPTQRGVKHVRSLTALAGQGCRCVVLIVIQMKGVTRFEPNWDTHPEFGEALIEAQRAGVEIIAVDCEVVPGSVTIDKRIPVKLLP